MIDPLTESDAPSRTPPRKAIVRPRMHLVYFMLAAFDLLAVCSSLYLIDRITNIHAESVEQSQVWGRRMDDYGALMRMAAAVNAPGNDVFESRDVDAESQRLEHSHAAFRARASHLRDELSRTGVAASLLLQFDAVNGSMSRMVEHAELIFESFRRNDVTDAGAHMAAMDRQYLHVTAELNELGVQVRALQAEYTAQQMATAASWRRLEWLLASFILIMVLAVTTYGFALARRMKRTAEELARHREHLSDMVAQRTRQLEETYEQLRHSDRLASIGTLAAGLGHDMNHVLLPVRAHLNALKQSEHHHSDNSPVQKIEQSVAYLQQLADGLHYLAMDPDKKDHAGGVTDVRTWWEQAGPLLRKAVPNHVELTADIADDLPAIAVAAHALTQAVLNLILNAGEAIPPPPQRAHGEGVVRLTAQRAAGDGWVRLSISDNGVGMTDEVKRRAFDMFFTTRPRGLGTGLGLAMVRTIVDRVGGSISVDSAVEKGTTISLLMAVADESRSRQPMTAAVRLRDRRAASLIQNLLQASGVRIDGERDPTLPEMNPAPTTQNSPGHSPENSPDYLSPRHPVDGLERGPDIWVVDPTSANLAEAQSWHERRSPGRIVLFGCPSDEAAASWSTLDPVTIADPTDLDAVRAAIGRAMSNS